MMKKEMYSVIAHLADGDVQITKKGGELFTIEEAEKVVLDHQFDGLQKDDFTILLSKEDCIARDIRNILNN